MDKIVKKINLEQAKNRSINKIPYYMVNEYGNACEYHEDENTWGGYTMDLVIPRTENECLPLINWANQIPETFSMIEIDEQNINPPTGETPSECRCDDESLIGAYWVRYKNLQRQYYWLINEFLPSIIFYKKCINSFVIVSNYEWRFDEDIQLFNSLSEASNVEIGEIIGITELYTEFIKKFKSIDIAKDFIDFFERLQDEGWFYPITFVTPYLDVDFAIDAKQTDLGIMSPLATLWVPKKKYYLGEIVIYNNQSYILIKCNTSDYDLYELTGELREEIINNESAYTIVTELSDIPAETFVYDKLGENKCYYKDNDKYYLINPYNTGKFDNITKITSFDVTCWTLLDVIRAGDPIREFTGITESKLISLKRRKASVDDSGNALPCVLYEKFSNFYCGELLYLIGICNETYDENNDLWYCDCLETIKCKGNGQSEWVTLEPSSNGVITSELIESDVQEQKGLIQFTYYIGCNFIKTNNTQGNVIKNRIPYTGVKYVEEWNYSLETRQIKYDGRNIEVTYANIYPVNTEPDETNIDINGKSTIYSNITYYGAVVDELVLLNTPYYKNESLMWVQDVNAMEYDVQERKYTSSVNVNIERGTAGAFERHNILGEIKTFSDLENYRNNFFSI